MACHLKFFVIIKVMKNLEVYAIGYYYFLPQNFATLYDLTESMSFLFWLKGWECLCCDDNCSL